MRPFLAKYLPIWGTLFQVEWQATKKALFEIGKTMLFSTLPFWLYSVINSVLSHASLEDKSPGLVPLFLSSLKDAVSNAELFILVAATLGAGLLSVQRVRSPDRSYRWQELQITVLYLFGILAAGFFFALRESDIMSNPFIVGFSALFYLVSIALLLPVIAIEKHEFTLNIADQQTKSQERYQEDYAKHRESLS